MDDSSQSDDDIDQKDFVDIKSDPLDDESAGDELDKDGGRPVRPVERQKMRPWLVELLDSNNVPGLSWQNRKDRIFRISWKHAAHNCFNRTRDSDLFERWAYHTGRHYEGNHKRWKANFRCALNSLPDVLELRDLGVRKGDNAFKVYKFLEGTDPMYKDKLDPKKRQSTMASQLKRREAASSEEGSSIPTSPEHDGDEEGGGGGMSALLKAIELHTQQGDTGKRRTGKRAKAEDKQKEFEGQSSPKRIKKEMDEINSNLPTIIHDDDIPVVKGHPAGKSKAAAEVAKAASATRVASPKVTSVSVHGAALDSSQVVPPLPASGAGQAGQKMMSTLPLIEFPYGGTIEQKTTGKITIVHLKKGDKLANLNPQDPKNQPEDMVVQLSASDVSSILSQEPKLTSVPVTVATSEGPQAVSTLGAILSTSQGQIFLSQEDIGILRTAVLQGQLAPSQGQPMTSQGPNVTSRVQNVISQGQSVTPQGQSITPQGQTVISQGQTETTQGQIVVSQGQVQISQGLIGCPPVKTEPREYRETKTPVTVISTPSTQPALSGGPVTKISIPLQGLEGKIPVQELEGKIGMPLPITLPMATIMHSTSVTKQGQDNSAMQRPLLSVPNVSLATKPIISSTVMTPLQGQSKGQGKVQNIPAPVADMLAWMKSHADQGNELGIKSQRPAVSVNVSNVIPTAPAAVVTSLVSMTTISMATTTSSIPTTTSSTSSVTLPGIQSGKTTVNSSSVISPGIQSGNTTVNSSSLTLPGIQSAKNIVNRFSSIAEALSMASGPGIMPELRAIRTQDVLNAIPKNPISVPAPILNPVIPPDSQNVRSKLVTRLLVSGTTSGTTVTGPGIRHSAPVTAPIQTAAPTMPQGLIYNQMMLNQHIPPPYLDPNFARSLGSQLRPMTTGVAPLPVNIPASNVVVTAVSANLFGPPVGTVALAGSAIMTNGGTKTTPSQSSPKEPELSPPPPALIRMDQVVGESLSDNAAPSNTGDGDSMGDSDMPRLEQQKEVKPDFMKEQVTIELSSMAEESANANSSDQYYYCLWCQKHFPKKVDLLRHFMNLHEDMLVVPGEGEKLAGTREVPSDVSGLKATGTQFNSSGKSSASGRPVDMQNQNGLLMNLMPGSANMVPGSVNIAPPGAVNLQTGLIAMPTVGSNIQEKGLDLTTKNKVARDSEVLDLRKKGKGRGKAKTGTAPKRNTSGSRAKSKKKSTPESQNLLGIQSFLTTCENQPVIGQSSDGKDSVSQNLIGQPKVAGRKETAVLPNPKYCLNSLIAALRDSIEKDKDKKDGDKVIDLFESDEINEGSGEMDADSGSATSYGGDSDDDGSIHSDMDSKSRDLDKSDEFRDLSPDSQSDDDETGSVLGVDKEIQVSLKTVIVDGKTMYRCSKCNKMFSKTCTFARHAMVHAKLYPYQCGICDDLKCSDMRVLLRHLDSHGENVECPCKKCERLYKEDLKTDTEQTKPETAACRFSCDICGKKFISDIVCKAHVNMHRRKTIECEICKMEFKCNRNLSKHRKSAHGVQFCPVCFESCRDMSTHIHLHAGVFMYKCGLCGDAFNSRPLLHDHLKVHTHLGKHMGSGKSQKEATRSRVKGAFSSISGLKSSNLSEMKTHINKEIDKKLKSVKDPKGNDKALSSQSDNAFNTFSKDDVSELMKDSNPSSNVKVKSEVVDNMISEDSTGAVSESSISNIGENSSQSGTMSLRQRKSRRCRWHDDDSVCERCDETFIKTIAFGRKPKSKSGKDSPRVDDSESRSSVKTLNEFSDSNDSIEVPPITLSRPPESEMTTKEN